MRPTYTLALLVVTPVLVVGASVQPPTVSGQAPASGEYAEVRAGAQGERLKENQPRLADPLDVAGGSNQPAEIKREISTQSDARMRLEDQGGQTASAGVGEGEGEYRGFPGGPRSKASSENTPAVNGNRSSSIIATAAGLDQTKPVLYVYEFSADWCPSCRILKPYYQRTASRYEGDARVRFVSVDVDDPAARPLVQKLGVDSVPLILVYDKNTGGTSTLLGLQQGMQLDRVLTEFLHAPAIER